ncbi:MAG: hypothetical protein Q9160_001128 [Pyrenula sp. 1 TL-2023]
MTQHLLRTTSSSVPIVATARANTSATKESLLSSLPSDVRDSAEPRLDVQPLDFTSESTISDLAGYCADRYNNPDRDKASHLRLAFCIPGRLTPERAPAQISYDDALETLKINLLAPMMLAKHFTPFLPKKNTSLEAVEGLHPHHAILAFMSARVGSISDNRLGGWYSYRASKAGVNQLVKTLDIFLKGKSGGKTMCVGLHPGTVKTDLSKEFWETTPDEKLFTPDFAVEKLKGVLDGLKDGDRGKCWDWQGKEVPP